MEKEVIIQLSGGLGNQMFMYAAARALALRIGARLRLDNKTGFVNDQLYDRRFSLHYFQADLTPASRLESFDYPGGEYLKKVSRRLGRHLPYGQMRFIREGRGFIPRQLLQFPVGSYYLEGYWQSEVCFSDCREIIRNDFNIVKTFSKQVKEEARAIREAGGRGVALCVRRYQEVKNFVHVSVVDKTYYLEAMDRLAGEIDNPVFFCFTQQPDWVKAELAGKYDIRFITPKIGDEGTIDDLYLMTLCPNFIISNSTFYWWGAWLAHADRVIAPSKWVFKGTPLQKWTIIDTQ